MGWIVLYWIVKCSEHSASDVSGCRVFLPWAHLAESVCLFLLSLMLHWFCQLIVVSACPWFKCTIVTFVSTHIYVKHLSDQNYLRRHPLVYHKASDFFLSHLYHQGIWFLKKNQRIMECAFSNLLSVSSTPHLIIFFLKQAIGFAFSSLAIEVLYLKSNRLCLCQCNL